MNSAKSFKSSSLPFFFFFIIFTLTQSCDFNDFEGNYNKGFLAYSSGLGVTEGVSIASYKEGDSTGYILLGSTDTGNERNDYIVKTDQDGNILDQIIHGDDGVDNIAYQVIVHNDFVYVLGDRLDRTFNRVVPHVSIYHLSNLEFKNEIYTDVIQLDNNHLNTTTFYEERSAGFFIENNNMFIATTARSINNKTSLYIYTVENLPEGDPTSFNPNTTLDTLVEFIGANINGRSVKMYNDTFFVSGVLSEHDDLEGETPKGYFVAKFDTKGNYFKSWANVENPDFSNLLDFEIIDNNNLILFYRNGNNAKTDIIELLGTQEPDKPYEVKVKSTNPLGSIYAVDIVGFDNLSELKIIDNTKPGYINKINEHYFISAIRKDDYAVIIDKKELFNTTDGLFTSAGWLGSWDEYSPFNNISRLHHTRNKVGNIIERVGGNGYAIIGTQDFIDDTKMTLMQLDENGNYIKN